MVIQLQKVTRQTLRRALGVSRIRELKNGDLMLADIGGNYGPHGKSNVNFILSSSLAPFDDEGNLIDFRQGITLKDYSANNLPRLYKLFGDCKKLGVLLASDLQPKTEKSVNLRLTFKLEEAKYLFIVRHHDAERQGEDWLKVLTLHYRPGKALLQPSEQYGTSCVDYLVLPLCLKDTDLFPGGLYCAGMAELSQIWARDVGQPEVVASAESISAENPPERAICQFKVDTYRTAMAIVDAVAITPQGFVLRPQIAPIKEFDQSYCEFEHANTYVWNSVAEDCVVVKYVQTCFLKKPEYLFLHQPAKLTTEQFDYLDLLQHHYQYERAEQIHRAHMSDILKVDGEQTWTKQIHQRLRGESNADREA